MLPRIGLGVAVGASVGKLTDRVVNALRARVARYEVWDESRKGFGVRVTPRGVKSFVWVYHFKGKPRRLTFGTYPRLSLADAGVKFAEAKQLLDKGIDPGSRAVADRVAERHAETVEELVSSYLERYARPRKRSAAEDERILRKDVIPRWGSQKARDVARRDIVNLLNGIVDRGAPIQANRTLTILRRMFRFAVGQAIIDVSPCDNIETPSAENQRERALSGEEIRLLWYALDNAPMEPNARRILRLMLVTGQRKGEVIGLHVDELDLETGLWTLPASRAKNRREHIVPFSQLAQEIIRQAPPGPEGYLFPSRLTGAPYRGQSIDHATRYLFEARRPSRRPRKSTTSKARLRKEPSAPPLRGAMTPFTPHDLRRTVATRMRELGIPRGDVKMVLNHIETDVTSRYDKYDGLAEKRRALEAWARRLEEIIRREPDWSPTSALAGESALPAVMRLLASI
jgi:integrase